MADSIARLARRLNFHPLIVLLISLIGASIYALWVAWRYSGDTLANQYYYVVPIVIPFVAFLMDRVVRITDSNGVGLALDVLVVGTAMMRVISDVPFVSGHALFLTYAAVGPGSRVTRIAAAVVGIEVVYLKFFVWHDLITPVTGIVLGLAAALIARRFETTSQCGPAKRQHSD